MSERFGSLMVEQIPRLRRYARALTGSAELADDLVQDCLERAWSRSAQWRPGSDLRAWLFTIMHNLYVSAVRARARRPAELALPEEEPASRAGESAEDLAASRDIERGIRTLAAEQREVLMLVALEGMRYEEVAAVLDLPLGTVMSRLYRARERLRRWLAEEAGPTLRRVK